jgi:hypothetical protein
MEEKPRSRGASPGFWPSPSPGRGAQALWLWNATTLAVTITKEARQLGLRQRLVLTGGNASTQYLGPAAMLRGGVSRTGINSALENRMRGFVGPGGRYYYSRQNHSGLGLKSMVVSRIQRCRMVPVENLKRRF